jgi:thiol-disulfide isomerase/thioredoxin/tetratricopeptide (TPR) repeat protein
MRGNPLPARLIVCAFTALTLLASLFSAPRASAQKQNPAPASGGSQKKSDDAISKKDADPEIELQKAIGESGNDRAALVRNLREYLKKFPDAPRKAAVYRALIESCQQLNDDACALDYAEQLIAVHPDDSEMMMLAVSLLQKRGDDGSLIRARGYVTRVIDRIEKSTADERSQRSSVADWQSQHDDLLSALYSLRGQIESSQHDVAAAEKDLEKSYAIMPNATSAEQLGELAEMKHENQKAIDQYVLAFVLPDAAPTSKIDRRALRQKLGNVWRQVQGSEAGLGEAILAAYDRTAVSATASAGATDPAAVNKHATQPLEFTLRTLDGKPTPLAPLKGKVLVLSFWATWCGPCRELEPQFVQVARSYAGNPAIDFFAVNTDEDQTLVQPFLAREKWNVPVLFADGLDDYFKVESLPTVIVLDATGKVTYRVNGFPPEGFTEALNNAIQSDLPAATAAMNATSAAN